MKRLIVLATVFLFALAGRAAAEVYHDAFDGTGDIPWEVKRGAFTVEDERYMGMQTGGNASFAIAGAGVSVQEGYVQTLFRTEKIGAYENAFIVFGCRDAANFYLIGAREGAEKWSLEQVTNGGAPVRLHYLDEVIDTDTDYLMKAVFSGNTVTLYVNGAEKLCYTFDALPEGEVGLGVVNGKAYYDDVVIGTTTVNVPRTMRFQALLKDKQSGERINADEANPCNVTFRLYEQEEASEEDAIWEGQYSLTIVEGMLDAELGPFDNISFNSQYWLGVEVESDGEMTPRFKLTAVPYAFTVEN